MSGLQVQPIKAKFRVTQIIRYSGMRGGQVVLEPVYSSKEGSENRKFWESLRVGTIDVTITDSEMFEYFKLNHAYYVDFTECERGIE